ncbi:MAG: peptidyl-alpha-hydroxyglycine alpha-amidating lyase family protein [Colwellia sp.]|nr:peptidyl-alpha-hydroxyglycine alpha-amidating lyase family protein [Colwellia sp.]
MFNPLSAKNFLKRGTLALCMSCAIILSSSLIISTANAGIVDTSRTEMVNVELPANWYLGEVAGLEFLPSGEMVVFNRGLHPLLIFSQTGQFEREIGLGLFKVPHGLFVDKKGFIWTTDQETQQVLKFDLSGKIKLILGRRNSSGTGWFENGYQLNLFNAPSDVALDSDNNIYVADGGNFRIVKFDTHGNLLKTWGSKGKEEGLFNFPHSLVIDDQDLIYVTDRQNARIQVFNTDGDFKKQWQDIGYPYELEQFDENTLIFTDARSGEINKIDFDGNVIERFGKWGKKESEFGFPHGLAIDKGMIYVGELLNWRIQKFK